LSSPDIVWERTFGTGSIKLVEGGGARVDATLGAPNPGRTLYTVPWPRSDFADISTVIVPPGSRRGEGHRCRCGLVLWQDADNYLTLTSWLDDSYDGASVSFFPKRHGFEELYDAIWTMVSRSIDWGVPYHLRFAFDSGQFLVSLNGEPVLERALSDIYPTDPPLRLTRVGLAVNWEWGDDTGSVFREFAARMA
jgi:hypothetical protein